MPANASGRELRYVWNRVGMDGRFDNMSMPAEISASTIRIGTTIVVLPRSGWSMVDVGVIMFSNMTVDGCWLAQECDAYREAFAASRCIAA